MRKTTAKPKYDVELLLGHKKTGMKLPKNTGNWFSYRVLRDGEEIGTLDVGRGSVFWKPYRNRRFGPKAFRRSWDDLAIRMQ